MALPLWSIPKVFLLILCIYYWYDGTYVDDTLFGNHACDGDTDADTDTDTGDDTDDDINTHVIVWSNSDNEWLP